MNSVTTVHELSPDEAAEQIYAAHAHEGAWLDAFAESLDRRRASRSFARTMKVWGLSQAEAARLFGVSRQALAKWGQHGIPSDRVRAVCGLWPPPPICSCTISSVIESRRSCADPSMRSRKLP